MQLQLGVTGTIVSNVNYYIQSIAHTSPMTSGKTDSGKHYHKSCTGDALVTAKAHESPQDITFFGACFCPFVQRVWVALEYLEIPYSVRAQFLQQMMYVDETRAVLYAL